MELNQEIDCIEYDGWSRDFIGYLIVVACGVSLMMVYIFRLPTYADEWWVLLLGILIIAYSARKAWIMFFSVPRKIVLKQSTLSFVFSNRVVKEHSYKDVSRLVMGSYQDDSDLIMDGDINFNKNYKVQIFFSQSDHKLLMDSLRYSNFKALIYIFNEKGMNHVIQKI
jgi:hypothetical protein